MGPDAADCAAVEARLLPRAETQTPGQVGAAVRRARAAIRPPDQPDRGREPEFGVGVEHYGDGTASLWARLAGVDAEVVEAAVDAYARAAKAAGDPRRLGELRAAALVEFAERHLAGPDAPRRHGRPVTVNVTIDLPSLLGLAERPGMLLGGAPVPAGAVRDLLGAVGLRRLVTDPLTGGRCTCPNGSTGPPPSWPRSFAPATAPPRCPGPTRTAQPPPATSTTLSRSTRAGRPVPTTLPRSPAAGTGRRPSAAGTYAGIPTARSPGPARSAAPTGSSRTTTGWGREAGRRDAARADVAGAAVA